jgi:hypothetical protein
MNNNTICCVGLWSGAVNIGGTVLHTHFVIFNCKGAFDVILDKPWLHKMNVIHYYKTDIIVINPDTTQTTLKNTNSTTTTTPNLTSISTIPIEDTNSQPSLDDMLETEASRVNTLQYTHG